MRPGYDLNSNPLYHHNIEHKDINASWEDFLKDCGGAAVIDDGAAGNGTTATTTDATGHEALLVDIITRILQMEPLLGRLKEVHRLDRIGSARALAMYERAAAELGAGELEQQAWPHM